MKCQGNSINKQSGVTLVIVLLGLIFAASYLWLGTNNAASNKQQFNTELNSRLLLAKEALIARAVTDANRPGSLPCPDLITDDNGLANHPHDGKSDNLTRNDCPSYVGWLPWITLDLPELTDASGSHFWYVLNPALRDDDAAQPINSDTASSLTLDGRGDIAALIIAPGAAVNGQNRPANNPADYLDDSNADGDSAFSSGPASDRFNDTVLALTRQELMSAVEKRVAGEVHACLEQHALASTNLWHDYPWPAPFSSTARRGKSGSLFGQIPETQPGPGPQNQQAATTAELSNARTRLTADSSAPAEQMNALLALNDTLVFAKTFYDRLYTTARNLALTAQTSTQNFAGLNSTLIAANSNGRISVTEKKNIQTASGTAQTELAPLQTALADTGLDAFPDELTSLNLTLQNKIDQLAASPTTANLGQLNDASQAQLTLFTQSHTSNSDIGLALTNSLSSGNATLLSIQQASANPGNAALLNTALNAARYQKTTNEQLLTTIAGNRITLHPDEISAQTSQLEALLTTFVQSPGTSSSAALAANLNETQSLIGRINTTSSSINPLRTDSLNALNAAINASQQANNWPDLASSTRLAIDHTNTLGNAIRTNGDNITKESLTAQISQFATQINIFNTVVTRTQAEMVPYAENLRLAAVDLQFWAEIINRHASMLATLARKSPAASKTLTNAASAYTLAEQILNSINKSSGSMSKLQDYLDAPNNSSKQNAANAALSDTLNQLDQLLQSTDNLGQHLFSSRAEAFPMLWYGSRCAFLQPGSDSTSWWQANQWANTVFFQISQRRRGSEGKLSVNGQGKYHSIAISAGKAINDQDRQAKRAASYFEDANADPSRDADAGAPTSNFINRPNSADFNDRLAY